MSDRSETWRTLLRAELETLHAYETPSAPAEIRLDGNESPWPLPAELTAKIAERIAQIPLHRYPDPRCTALREALARHLGASPDELIIGTGSDEVIEILECALARPRDGRAQASVLFPDPGFSMYGIIARARGLAAHKVPLGGADSAASGGAGSAASGSRSGFELDVAAFERAIAEHRPNLVFIASPNNPTGNAFDRRALEQVIALAHDALVVLDEAYIEFANERLMPLFDRHPNVAVIGTLSKIGMAGLRVGWARARPGLARELEKVRLTYNIPAPSQVIATLALTELWPQLREHIELIKAERVRLFARLASEIPGVAPYPSDANLILAELPIDGSIAAARVREQGIQIRSFGEHPRLRRCVRISVGTPAENDALITALGRALA